MLIASGAADEFEVHTYEEVLIAFGAVNDFEVAFLMSETLT